MAKKAEFGLTLANRGVVIGVTTVGQMLQMSEIADASNVYDWVWVGDSILAKPRLEAVALLSAVAASLKTQNGTCLHGEYGAPASHHARDSMGEPGFDFCRTDRLRGLHRFGFRRQNGQRSAHLQHGTQGPRPANGRANRNLQTFVDRRSCNL